MATLVSVEVPSCCRECITLGTIRRNDRFLEGEGVLFDSKEYSSRYSGVKMRPHLSFSREVGGGDG